ncbi:Hint domain-containing protein [uncultured Roseovarius sp.]|uniref:Hint domain-containing protein n=1 Tax=uncultured Roseovarius sp. TaxID=293344 RepID=UPI002628C1DF|nr:Hint domain-containing protein [uncultured Roseovarius sp.]
MPTTFNWIHLGNSPLVLDPTEGNSDAENAALFVNQSYGTATDPLYEHITSATTIDNGGAAGALDMNNSVTNDEFTTDIGNGVETFTFDGLSVFDATITYADGTTATVTAVLAQSTDGELFLAPEFTANGDVNTFEAGPIISLTLDGVNASTNTNLGADRLLQGWDDGVVDGTGGNDLIDSGYVEPITSGSDRVDNGDGLSGAGFNDDVIEAGAGSDTVLAGLGEDLVSGGTGADSLSGEAGNDTLLGQGGPDTLIGGAGDDSLEGGDGNDVLHGDAGPNERWSYEVYTRDFSSADGQAFDIESGTLAASGTTDAFDVTAHGQQATGQPDPNDYGVIYSSNLIASEDGVHRFETTSDDGSTIRILDSQGNPLTFSNQDGSTGSFLDNDFHQSATTRWGEVTLDAGQSYTIEVRYWENLGGNVLSGQVTLPGGATQDLASSPLIVGADSIAGDDYLDGGNGADLLFGEGGEDTLIAGENDTLYGGDGDDLFVIETPSETGTGTLDIVGGEGDETTGDTLFLSPEASKQDITFSNTDDTAGGLSGTFTLSDGTLVSFSEIENIICFTPGARLLTPQGGRLVETLRAGDLLITRDNGPQPIRWIGQRTVPGIDRFAPIRIAAHVLDNSHAPLLVSPQHRFLFKGYKAELLFGCDEVLVSAKHLIDGRDVSQAPQAEVTYIHVMLDRHEVIYADGAATESFHADDVGLTAISDQSREEMFRIFPEMRSHPDTYGPTARPCLKRHEARLLQPCM